MKNVSAEFINEMQRRSDFYLNADVTFADNRTLKLTKKDFYMSGNGYTDCANAQSFPVGVALEKQINVSLINDDDRFSTYDFYGSRWTINLMFDLPSGTESVLMGTYTVTDPESYGTTVDVSMVDDMFRGDVEYSTGLKFPATLGEILVDSCRQCGVTLYDSTFANYDFSVSKKPEGCTHREVWGMIAAFAGGNARMDEKNRLHIMSYDFSGFDADYNADGGTFHGTATPYEDGANLYGGIMNPWTEGDAADAGTFKSMVGYHIFYMLRNITVSTDDVVITGVKVGSGDNVKMYGKEGYVISINDALADEHEQDAANRIGRILVGMTFRPFTLDHSAYPTAEFGDICEVVDRRGNRYRSVITDVDFSFYGWTTIKCSADSPLRNSSKYNSAVAQTIVSANKRTEEKLTAYELAVRSMNDLITKSMGIYRTEQTQDDGSVIMYMHDKPTLEGSQKIWRMAADVFSVSDNGGRTWKAGLDSSGNAVLNVLSAVGINFDWAYGGTLSLGGSNNQNGVLRVRDASGNEIGSWNRLGITANAGTIGGCRITNGVLKIKDANIDGTINANHINAASLKIKAANIEGTLEATQINTKNLTVDGKNITAASISSNSFNSGCASWAAGIAGNVVADIIEALTIKADKIYPNKGDYIWFPNGPVLVTRLQVDGESSITCRDGQCGNEDYPFREMWSRAYRNPSRRDIKRDITEYEDGMSVIRKAQPVRYHYIADPDGGWRYGFIADEAPEEITDPNRESIDLYNCIGVMWSAIKELSAELEELKRGDDGR